MGARHPLPYAYAKAHTLLLEDDGRQLVLWAPESISLPALSEVLRLYEVDALEREAAATLVTHPTTMMKELLLPCIMLGPRPPPRWSRRTSPQDVLAHLQRPSRPAEVQPVGVDTYTASIRGVTNSAS